MSEHGEMAAWRERLAAAQSDLRERERRAVEGPATERELHALAAERDKLAAEEDALADAYDEQARQRDSTSLRRDLGASTRDRSIRTHTRDLDLGAEDRFLAGVDREFSAGDRADSLADRRRSSEARRRAAEDRQRAADDRDAATSHAEDLEDEIAGLREALKTRLLIGQAEGLLMARYQLDGDAAFRLLTKLSQEAHIKLREVAARLVADANGGARADDLT